MQSIKDVISKLDISKDKYVTRSFQAFGVYLAEVLGDQEHKSLYIKLAKTHPRKLLEEVLGFVIDSEARNKGALFMWKLKKQKQEKVL